MKLLRWKNFKEKEFLNESVLYFSSNLRKILKQFVDDDLGKNSEIARKLMEIELNDSGKDITFIDLDEKSDISFSKMSSIKRGIEENPNASQYSKIIDNEPADSVEKKNRLEIISKIEKEIPDIWKKSRNPIKIGKLINSLLPNEYTPTDINKFVDMFREKVISLMSKKEHFEKFLKEHPGFEIVEGDDIAYWYNESNYDKDDEYYKGSKLELSCMKYDRCHNYFDIYTQNPQVCRMLILKKGDKLVGRALIWKIKPGKDYEYFMDRQYCIYNSDKDIFIQYANLSGWAYKTYNTHHNLREVSYGGSNTTADLTVEIKKLNYNKYPYMDTFRRFHNSFGCIYLFNYGTDDSEYEGDLVLDSTEGRFSRIEAEETDTSVWSEYEERDISEDESVWSSPHDSYIHTNRSIWVSQDGNYYPRDSDLIARDEYSNSWIVIDNSTWSDYYGGYIDRDYAELPIISVTNEGIPSIGDYIHSGDGSFHYLGRNAGEWVDFLRSEWSEWDDYYYIDRDIIEKDYLGNYILEVWKIDAVILGDNEFGLKYITRELAGIVGIQIPTGSKSVIIDKFRLYMQDSIPEFKKILESKLKELYNELEGKGQLKINFPINSSNIDSAISTINQFIEDYEIFLK